MAQFHYLPLPDSVTARVALPAYPAGPAPLQNRDLADRIQTLETIVGEQNCKLAAAECLGNAIADSPQAQACTAALEQCTGEQ